MQASRVKLDEPFTERPGPDAIRRELALILQSASFRSSKRCHDFLEFVVNKELEGDIESLKERTLAVEVFGRRADADLAEDSIVRVGAREVRKRLAQYYVTDGSNDPLRIDLLAGSYVPTYHAAGAQTVPARETPAPPLAIQNQGRFSSRRVLTVSLVVLVGAGATVLGLRASHRTPEEFESFWRPAFAQQSPLVIGLAHPIVYHPSSRITRLNDEKSGPEAVPLQRPIELPPGQVSGADFVPVFDQYVGFGDTVAASRLSVLFAQHGRNVRLRLASKLEFADIRDSATVLIGAFTNRWTMEMDPSLRFRLAMADSKPCILDSVTHQQWTLTGKSDNGHSAEDYIVIARLAQAQSGGFVIIAAGLTQYGTQEAGRILTAPEALAPVLRKVPANWTARNLELVLHVRIVGDTPTPPELLASHVW